VTPAKAPARNKQHREGLQSAPRKVRARKKLLGQVAKGGELSKFLLKNGAAYRHQHIVFAYLFLPIYARPPLLNKAKGVQSCIAPLVLIH
jgi:hypothetical protein